MIKGHGKTSAIERNCVLLRATICTAREFPVYNSPDDRGLSGSRKFYR